MVRQNRWSLKALILFVIMMMLLSTSVVAAETPSPTIIVEDVKIEMRDGVKLAAKVARPKADGKFPVLLTRTPYGASSLIEGYGALAQLGYGVVIQDVRGVFESEGNYEPYVDDAEDGYDTVKWASEQAWSNGKVGVFGTSAMGITASLLAGTQPPGLEAMFWQVTPAQGYEETMFYGGAYRHELVTNWLAGVNISNAANLLKNGKITQQKFQEVMKTAQSFPDLYWKTPLKDLPSFDILKSYQDIFEHYVKDGYMDYQDITLQYPNINVPIYHVGGWYDIFEEGTLKNFEGLQTKGANGAKGNQKLLVGPWQHRDIGDSKLFVGDEINVNAEMVRWFDYWLKGKDNGIMDEAPVKYYTMGDNQWKTAETWPISEAKNTTFYFTGDKSGSADSLNDGTLSKEKPTADKGSTSYIYDPKDPIVTIGGQNLYPETYGAGPMDQRPAEKDSLTYTSSILKNDIEVTGKVEAKLFVSSDAKDTDFTVKLTDVAPDGTSTLLKDGIMRARFREGLDKEVFMEKGKTYEIEVNLNNLSHTFKKGHRIRVSVASSNFPRFDRNSNTGNKFGVDSEKDFVVANNTVYHDVVRASSITLPVVEKKIANPAFADIKEHWAFDAIQRLAEKRVVDGYPDGTFRPEGKVTRAEFTTLLINALDVDLQGDKVFQDTKNHWAKAYIATAVKEGIAEGYNVNTFGPDDPITREQMAVMIVRALKLDKATDATTFVDEKSVSSWATDQVQTAVKNGLIEGYPDKTFKPKGNTTRAEAVTVFDRMVK